MHYVLESEYVPHVDATPLVSQPVQSTPRSEWSYDVPTLLPERQASSYVSPPLSPGKAKPLPLAPTGYAPPLPAAPVSRQSSIYAAKPASIAPSTSTSSTTSKTGFFSKFKKQNTDSIAVKPVTPIIVDRVVSVQTATAHLGLLTVSPFWKTKSINALIGDIYVGPSNVT
ncbi:hypothetical protein BCR33DRAFT_184431 [Rhizoclosmatium globosum]|uniref:Uncharacterized protein n=1 Tax=Rhizoclosmatium globosum TaxID=329046 RepID=A0A1Y2D1E8_9FUNG|nr:hypothetical protein BCR33DRAFT_184431 [Rhizoclosmatium globosum]|eukprot:ORY53017.1 hypothetical protein BCR33DRAFT_184431 [Rhizoclosmatium globosum]